MYGTAGLYSYRRCISCGFVWLYNPPVSVGSHYPPGYGGHWGTRMPWIDPKRPLKKVRSRLALHRRCPWPSILRRPFWDSWFARTGLTLDSSLCDIGCGNGYHLVQLWREGFSNLSGFDAFIERDLEYRGRVLVRRADLADVVGIFDLVMLHHSLEHMPDQLAAMTHVRGLVRLGGFVLVRVPLVDSWAAYQFGGSWYQLDAPRHHALHTRLSLAVLAAATGFRIERVSDDSTDGDLEASSRYARRRNDRLLTGVVTPDLDSRRLGAASSTAGYLNNIHLGDQSCFLLEAI